MSAMNYILYHGNCNDGFGAALVAWLYFGKQLDTGAVYLPVYYGQPVPQMQEGCDVFIVDFSYPAKDLLDLAAKQNKVVVLDHHATAQADLAPDKFPGAAVVDGVVHVNNLAIQFDMSKSGAVLAWEYFFPGQEVPLLIQYIQDRDLWKFEMVNSRAVSAYLQTREMDFNVWERIMREITHTADQQEIFRAGAACLKLKEQMVDSMARNGFPMLFDMNVTPPRIVWSTSPKCFDGQFIVPTANATCFFSEVGERLLELHPEAQFAAYYLDRADGRRQWGLRSRAEFDCSIIAKAFGGGGHKQAAGFTADMPW